MSELLFWTTSELYDRLEARAAKESRSIDEIVDDAVYLGVPNGGDDDDEEDAPAGFCEDEVTLALKGRRPHNFGATIVAEVDEWTWTRLYKYSRRRGLDFDEVAEFLIDKHLQVPE
jgi:hypothetical protein